MDELFSEYYCHDLPDAWKLPQMNEDAAYKALAKNGRPQPVLDEEQEDALLEAAHWMSQAFGCMRDSKICSLPEAMGRLKGNTSPGYPFTAKYHTKSELFENEPDFSDWLEGDWDDLCSVWWTTIFMSSQKEELRPVQKVVDNSLRNYMASAVDFTVHGERLFGDMNRKLLDSHLITDSTVGMSPFEGNWHKLITSLGRHKGCFSTDGRSYDAFLFRKLMTYIFRFRWSCLADEFQTKDNFARMSSYYRNLIDSVIITPLGTLVQKGTGGPSGSVNTISDNTLVMEMIMSYAWIRRCQLEGRPYKRSDFVHSVRKKIQGDDNIWNVSLEELDFYNFKNVQPLLLELGLETTTESEEPLFPWNLGYLSQRSRWKYNKWIPYPDEDKMICSMAHVRHAKRSPQDVYERAIAYYTQGYYNDDLRLVVGGFLDWLEKKFAKFNSPDWMLLTSQRRGSSFYRTLYTGENLFTTEVTERSESCGKIKAYIQSMRTNSKGVYSKQQRGDVLLKRMESGGYLTEHGASWFKTATNPFPDTPIEDCRGIPDYCTEPSIVRRVKKSINITKPLGLGGDEWSFQVAVWPWLNKISMVTHENRVNNIVASAPAGAEYDRGGIEVLCLPTGTPNTENLTDFWNIGSDAQYRIELGEKFGKGMSRLIGMGYEVSDNTAEIYKQGHSYHYRQSNQTGSGSTWSVSIEDAASPGAATIGYATLQPVRPLMPTPEEAMLLPDTVDWPAKEGVYSVMSFNGINPPHYVDYKGPVIFDNTDPSITDDQETYQSTAGLTPTTQNITPVSIPWVQPTNNVLIAPCMPAIKMENINQSCSMFTGLNNVASFTLTVHMFIESFPSIAEEEILVLAEPSASYDGVALEMYSRAVMSLPVAVPVGLNPDGEWWAGVVETAADVLSPIAAAFGFPEAVPFVMGGGRLVANAIKRNSKPTPPPQPKVKVVVQANKKKKPNQQPQRGGRGGALRK